MKAIFSAYGVITFVILILISVGIYYVYGTITNIDDIKGRVLELYVWGNTQNQFATAGVSLWLLGVGTYLARDVPRRVWQFIVKQSTVTLTINNQDDVYDEFLAWYQKTGRSKKSRTLVAQDATRHHDVLSDSELRISSGYGLHFFVFKGRMFSFTRTEKEAVQTRQTKETIELKTIGRSQIQFIDLLTEVTATTGEEDTTHIYRWLENDTYWNKQGEQAARKFDSVILPKETKDEIVNHLDTFIAERKWYMDNGIPYRTGIMLHGIPGSGKTSLVRGLCQKLKKPLHVISLNATSIKTLDEAFGELPRGAVCLMEDIDGYAATKTRNGMASNEELAMLLNAIDGISASDGRILIATTNDIDSLDSALIRKGRFNLSINIGYLTEECFRQFFANFYPNFPIVPNTKFKDDMSPAQLQALIIDHRKDAPFVLSHCVVQND